MGHGEEPPAYNKLIRDNVPELIRENGETPVTRTATDEEYEHRLCEKLDEEVTEYILTRDPIELIDILEVIDALRLHAGLSASDIHELREQRAQERGRFESRLIINDIKDTE